MADKYGTFAVTFRDSKGRETVLKLTDLQSEVREQASFYSPSYGKVVKVVEAK